METRLINFIAYVCLCNSHVAREGSHAAAIDDIRWQGTCTCKLCMLNFRNRKN